MNKLDKFIFPMGGGGNKSHIFDIIRKKYVSLTPEELTRQHFVHYLINVLNYPKSLIQIERVVGGYSRMNRFDLVVYEKTGKAFLLAECKASHVPLTRSVYSQVLRYNAQLKAPFIVITNGIDYGCWQVQYHQSRLIFLNNIPSFSEDIHKKDNSF